MSRAACRATASISDCECSTEHVRSTVPRMESVAGSRIGAAAQAIPVSASAKCSPPTTNEGARCCSVVPMGVGPDVPLPVAEPRGEHDAVESRSQRALTTSRSTIRPRLSVSTRHIDADEKSLSRCSRIGRAACASRSASPASGSKRHVEPIGVQRSRDRPLPGGHDLGPHTRRDGLGGYELAQRFAEIEGFNNGHRSCSSRDRVIPRSLASPRSPAHGRRAHRVTPLTRSELRRPCHARAWPLLP